MNIHLRTCSFVLLVLIAALGTIVKATRKAEANGGTSFAPPRFENNTNQSTVSAATTANGRIVFTRSSLTGQDIVTINPDGSGALNLTPYLGRITRDTSPAWSPDGRRIVFVSDRDGNRELYVMDANGNGVARLTNTPSIAEGHPEWSPDGTRIAYTALPSDTHAGSDIYILNFIPSADQILPTNQYPPVRLTTNRRVSGLAWSPDSSRIVFDGFGTESTSALYVMNADGTNQRVLYDSPGSNDSSPAWSPDGTRILFTHSPICVLPCSNLGVVNADGSNARNLSGVGYSVSPAWSPDGTRIVFAGNISYNTSLGIYVMNSDGSGVRRITNDPPNIEVADFEPSWGMLPASSAAGDIRFDFVPSLPSVPENVGFATIVVRRSGGHDSRGELDREVSVRYLASNNRLSAAGCSYTLDLGTATPGADYTEARGELVFAPGEEFKTFRVQIIDDVETEVRFTDGGVPRPRQTETVFLTLDYSQYAVAGNDRCYGASGILEIVDNEPSSPNAELRTWTLDGRSYGYVKLTLPDGSYFIVNRGQVVRNNSEFVVTMVIGRQPLIGTRVPISIGFIYELGALAPGAYSFVFDTNLSEPRRVTFTVGAEPPAANPIDDARTFVTQHYRDFLAREPDEPGLNFWTNEITSCGADASCIDRKRVNTSGAFFLSEEFQSTGYYVYRIYKGALGRAPLYAEFVPDVRKVAAGIVVDNRLSPEAINSNKELFARAFVEHADFRSMYGALSDDAFLDRLLRNAGVRVNADERQALLAELTSGGGTILDRRARVLARVVDGIRAVPPANGGVGVDQVFETSYGRAFYEREFNSAFVLMEYFGYLRRDPDPEGYQFWLDKLNRFGNFTDAEMVRSFILAAEYRSRFGHP